MSHRLRLPFPPPHRREAASVASPGYWREVRKRCEQHLRSPRLRALLKRLGVLRDAGVGDE